MEWRDRLSLGVAEEEAEVGRVQTAALLNTVRHDRRRRGGGTLSPEEGKRRVTAEGTRQEEAF